MTDKYVSEASKMIVAHLVKQHEFDSITVSSLDVLFELMSKYIEEIGYSSHLYANISGRTQVNVLDVLASLYEKKITLEDLVLMYTEASEVQPFPKQISPFPVPDYVTPINELHDPPEALPENVPYFLPPFPDKHTYIATPATDESIEDLASIRKNRNKRKRQVEESLHKLATAQQSASSLSSSSEDQNTKPTSLSSSSSFEPPLKNPYMEEPVDPNQILHAKPTKAPNPEKYASLLKPKEVVETKPRVRVDREDDAERQRKQNKLFRVLQTQDAQSATKIPDPKNNLPTTKAT
eukprot:TRINITY_DN17530_c0_g1_i1.p1 TRINITY_DN17530_c0_g1~~TRINITY_DN17530_c0_g1_i1.p1  ORF type:complete len:301 (-),score=119.10 TRINITY_DN17530_c0_g1_i1:38-919(-)